MSHSESEPAIFNAEMMDKQCDGVCACHKWFCVIKVCKQGCCCWSSPHQWQLGDNVTGVRQVPEYQHQFNHDELAISMFYQWFWVWIWLLIKHTNQIMSSVVHVAHWHIGHCMQSKSRLAHHGRDRLRFPTIPWQISMVFGRFRFDFMLSGSSSPVQLTCKLRDMTDNDLTDKTAIATTLAAWYSQPCFFVASIKQPLDMILCKCKPANFPGFARVSGLTAMSVDRSVNIAAKVLGLHGWLHWLNNLRWPNQKNIKLD